MRLELTSHSLEDTLQIAEKVGQRLKGGEVIELRSDVGGGKTTFVKGIVKGLGSDDQVSSPTFTISKIYNAPHDNISVHHFDFYRLQDPGLMRSELGESVASRDIVTIVEWAGVVNDVIPEDRLVIELFSVGENSRMIHFEAGADHEHILQGIFR